MKVIMTTTLNPSQKAQIQSLDAGFPIEDADLFAFCETEDAIRSAAAFIQENETEFECYAYTAPGFRRRGFFTELLDAAIEYLPDDTQFFFYTNGKDPDCMATIRALEAELFMEEHMMNISLSEWNCFNIQTAQETLNHTVAQCKSEKFSSPLSVHTIELEGTQTLQYENANGFVNISVFSSYYYLYGFEIREELRGKGHGKTFLGQVLTDLAARNPMPLRLQVSGDNIPALSLYEKTGFQITETLFGYLY